jgi:hypothetical protein
LMPDGGRVGSIIRRYGAVLLRADSHMAELGM